MLRSPMMHHCTLDSLQAELHSDSHKIWCWPVFVFLQFLRASSSTIRLGHLLMSWPHTPPLDESATILCFFKLQDNVRNKVEQIKASITLPFQPFFRACEVISIDHSSKSKDLSNQNPSNQESQVDEVVCNANADSKIEIENTKPDLKKFNGVMHGEEGMKHRAWWPPVHVKDTLKASVTAETNHRELPPSLSELRQQKNYKHRSGHQFVENTLNSNDFRGGKKRKKISREFRNANKGSAVTSESRSQFKPFDYAAARLSSNMPVKDAKDGNANKKLSLKKGKGLAFDPMNRVARESNADVIQPGKRRQVFPASGNRSATFQ